MFDLPQLGKIENTTDDAHGPDDYEEVDPCESFSTVHIAKWYLAFKNAKTQLEKEKAKKKLENYKTLSYILHFYSKSLNPVFLLKAFIYAYENGLDQPEIVMDLIIKGFKRWFISQAKG